MEHITINVSGKKARNATLYGRPHLVAPLTMIVEGVLNGSQGPIYYPKDETEKSVPLWNGVPIVLYHPTSGSAKDPDVLNTSGLGIILNAKMDNAQLKAEGWFDVDRLTAVSPEVLTALNNGDQVELSTGLGIDAEVPKEETPVFNSKPYSAIARNYKPDHLAVLPDQVGACSIEDGCGVFNKAGKTCTFENVMLENVEFSHEQLHSMLSQKLRSTRTQDQPHAWIEYVYDSYFIYEERSTYYKLGYSVTDSGVELTGSPQEVIRETNFVTLNNEETEMEKGTAVKNCSCDDKILNGMTDEQKTAYQALLAENQKLKEGTVTTNQTVETTVPETPAEPKVEQPAKVENTQPVSAKDWLASAPAEIRTVVSNMMARETAERTKVINELTEGLPEDQKKALIENSLGSKSLQELELLRSLRSVPAPKKVNNYGGQAFGIDQGTTTQVENNEDLILPIPVINYDEAKKVS